MELLVAAGAALRGTASVIKPGQTKDQELSAAGGEALREMHPAKANSALGGSPNRAMAPRGLVVGASSCRLPCQRSLSQA